MAKHVKSWEANDGSLHKDKVKAARRDVEMIVEKRFPTHATAQGHEVAEWLLEEREPIIMALTDYHRLAPPITAKAPAPPESTERTLICYMCGTAEDKPHSFRHVAQYIPEHVYYSDGNFYDMAGAGLGTEFYEKWREKADLFPKSREDAQALHRKGIARLGDE